MQREYAVVDECGEFVAVCSTFEDAADLINLKGVDGYTIQVRKVNKRFMWAHMGYPGSRDEALRPLFN